jgi:hypothetical protein
VRNRKVAEFRKSPINRIDELYDAEILKYGVYTPWRFIEYNKVSYETMLYKFWKPLKLEAFYKDLSFLQEI